MEWDFIRLYVQFFGYSSCIQYVLKILTFWNWRFNGRKVVLWSGLGVPDCSDNCLGRSAEISKPTSQWHDFHLIHCYFGQYNPHSLPLGCAILGFVQSSGREFPITASVIRGLNWILMKTHMVSDSWIVNQRSWLEVLFKRRRKKFAW